MKKCPFCAEEIQDDAIFCKYCKSSMTEKNKKQNKKSDSDYFKNSWALLKFIGIILLIGLGIYFWYIAIPVLIFWGIWKKNYIKDKNKKITYSGVVALISIGLWIFLGIMSAKANKAPVITIIEPNNNITIQAETVDIKGKIDQPKAELSINDRIIALDDKGNFNFIFALQNEINNAKIQAKNGGRISETSLLINRVFTEAEKAEREQQIINQKNKAKEDLINQLNAAIKNVQEYKRPNRGSVDAILNEVNLFPLHSDLMYKTRSKEADIKKLYNSLVSEVGKLQAREFPIIRKEYGKVVGKTLWEQDIEVSISGANNSVITLVGGLFAANKNIAQANKAIEGALKSLRFKRVQYKWYRGASEYNYYDLEPQKDSEL